MTKTQEMTAQVAKLEVTRNSVVTYSAPMGEVTIGGESVSVSKNGVLVREEFRERFIFGQTEWIKAWLSELAPSTIVTVR